MWSRPAKSTMNILNDRTLTLFAGSVELRGTTPMSAQISGTPHPNLLPMLVNVLKLKIVSNPVSLKILPMFFHL
jgi:hypothetical protein